MPDLPSLFAVKAFVLASQYQSFTKTAEVMFLTQGAVSRQIKQLEAQLDVQLFVREHHLVRLTGAGKKLLPYFQEALERVNEGMALLRDEEKSCGHLWLNIAPTFSTRWLVPRLSSFFKQHPGIKLTVTTDYDPDEAYHERADCQVRFGTKPLGFTRSELLFREENVLVGLPELREQAADMHTLLQSNTLLHILGGYNRLEVWEQWFRLTGMQAGSFSEGLSFSTMDQVINAVLNGVGVALLDKNMIEKEIRSGKLAELSPVTAHGPYGYWLDSRAREDKAHVLRVFRTWLLTESRLAREAAMAE